MLKNVFQKLKVGLEKTRQGFTHQMDQLFGYYEAIDDEFYEDLEELLILADVGFDTTEKIMDILKERIVEKRVTRPLEVRELLKEVMSEFLDMESKIDLNHPPKVILVIGVNGAGKTTSIGKLAHLLKDKGHTVLLAAADTFRAAAIDQLKVWAQRADVDCIAHQEGSDPSSVVYDGLQAAQKRGVDVLICDTAGRLHNKKNLMKELEKMKRVILRETSEDQVLTLLVLDATTGQNALNQAKLFQDYAQMDGIILTKLDGTSKGGFIFAVKDELNLPVEFMTLGEKIEDIERFSSSDFVEAFFAKEETYN